MPADRARDRLKTRPNWSRRQLKPHLDPLSLATGSKNLKRYQPRPSTSFQDDFPKRFISLEIRPSALLHQRNAAIKTPESLQRYVDPVWFDISKGKRAESCSFLYEPHLLTSPTTQRISITNLPSPA